MGNCFSRSQSPGLPITRENHGPLPENSGNLNRPLNTRSINSNPQDIPNYDPPIEPNSTSVQTAWTSSTSTDVIIGIDFGTTYTGVAYAHGIGAGPVQTASEMRRAVDKVSVIKSWPNRGNSYAEKTPSVLSYDRKPPRWGAEVKPKDEPQVAYFKLGLQEDHESPHYEQDSQELEGSSLGGYLYDPGWTHPSLPLMKPLDYATDFLTAVNQYVKQGILLSRFGERFLENQKLSYVLTVPAIWSDKARQLTRKAAVAAGIEDASLTLITEPEAAALYCATLCDEVDLDPGDRFMICDAGGGTVVIIPRERHH
jgi:hypothetical protein